MSQPVGFQYKSRIPTLSDDATIVEALKVYHFGVDNYSTEPIPDDSIEGNFRTLGTAVSALQSSLSGLGTTFVEQVSLTATPNVITGQSTTTTPLTLRSITSQTSPLQQWQNSSSVNVGSVGTAGNMNLAGYLTLGTTTQSTTVGLNVITGNAAHNGIVVRAQTSQTANIQEWQNSGGTAMAFVNKDGKIFSNGVDLVSSLSEKFPLNVSTNVQTSSYTLVAGDAQKIIEMNSSTTNELTIPLDFSANFAIGSSILVIQTGTGQTTIRGETTFTTGGAGPFVTVNSYLGLKIIGRYAGATLIKRGFNTWVAVGGLVA